MPSMGKKREIKRNNLCGPELEKKNRVCIPNFVKNVQ